MPSYKDEKTGKWYCQFYYKDWRGKSCHKVKRGFARKKDADKWEIDFKSKEHADVITMDKLIEDFIKSIDTSVELGAIKQSTAKTKKDYIRLYIKDYYAGVRIDNVKTKDVEQWLSSLLEITPKELISEVWTKYYASDEPRKTKRSSRTINAARNILKQIFDYAKKNHNLQVNPVEAAQSMKFYSNDKRAKLWTLEEYQTFYNSLTDDGYKVFFNLLYWSGLRLGEALALTTNDVLPYKLIINKTKSGDTITSPKTLTSNRVVEIPKQLYFQIMDYIDRLYDCGPDDEIFIYEQQRIRLYLYKAAMRLDLPRISPHILRHSYASLLYSQTKDILVVANQIGHSNPAITYKVYSHMMPEENRKAINSLEVLIDEQSKTTQILNSN